MYFNVKRFLIGLTIGYVIGTIFWCATARADKLETSNPVLTGSWDYSAADLEVPNSTTCAATDCDAAGEAGRICMDTDATTGRQIYGCEGVTGWVLQGDGGASGGDDVTVNSTAATNANFLDNIYVDFAIDTAPAPDNITAKPDYSQTLAGNPALLTTELTFMADGIIAEGTTADTIEYKLAFPDPAGSDKTATLFNATDTIVGRDTTDTLTNKTMAAGSNVLDADTAVALAANGSNCSASNAPLGVDASGAVESCTDFEEELTNSAGLAAALSDETGTGAAVFGTSPTLSAPTLNGNTTVAGAPSGNTRGANDEIVQARVHATDCTAVTDGKAGEFCMETDANTIYVCEPSAGDCDTAGEWFSYGGGGADTNADKEFTFTASAMEPLEAADSIPPLSKFTGTNVDIFTISYDSATDECRQVQIVVPQDVQSGSTITFTYEWWSNSVTTNDVVWDTRYQSTGADGESWDAALTTISQTCTVAGTTKLRDVCTDTETLANLGWVAGDSIYISVCRDANHASDTMTGDAELSRYSVRIPRA